MNEISANSSDDRDYIKALIEDLESDKKSVLLYLVFEFGMIVMVMTKTFPTSQLMPLLVLISLILLLISALLFFKYFRELHCARLEVTDCLKGLDTEKAHRIVKGKECGIWARHKVKFNWAKGLLYTGVGLFVLELLFLYASNSGVVQNILRLSCNPNSM